MYRTFNEVKKDYPIGKIMTNGIEQYYNCKLNSRNFQDFIERFQNNDFVVSMKNTNGIVSVITRYPHVEYNVIDYGYIASKDIWFPITAYTHDFEHFLCDNELMYDKFDESAYYPKTYNEVIDSIKKSNKTILSNTVEE